MGLICSVLLARGCHIFVWIETYVFTYTSTVADRKCASRALESVAVTDACANRIFGGGEVGTPPLSRRARQTHARVFHQNGDAHLFDRAHGASERDYFFVVRRCRATACVRVAVPALTGERRAARDLQCERFSKHNALRCPFALFRLWRLFDIKRSRDRFDAV